MKASRNTECSMPETGPRAPARTLVAVRAMVPVTQMPPNKADPILAKPCATSSQLERCLRPVMPSATTADNSDSIAPNSANEIASGNTALAFSNEKAGHTGPGRPQPAQHDDDGDAEGCDRHRRCVDGVGGARERAQLGDQFARLLAGERDAEQIPELACKDDHRDPGGEPHRHRIGNELDIGAEAEAARRDQQNPGDQGGQDYPLHAMAGAGKGHPPASGARRPAATATAPSAAPA